MCTPGSAAWLPFGGALASLVEEVGAVLIVTGTIFAMAFAGYAGFAGADVSRYGAVGSGIGLCVGALIALIDRLGQG